MRVSSLRRVYDQVDRTIVEILSDDGRITIPALAERVGVSRSTAYTRFTRLVDDGVVQGFRAVVPPDQRGLGVAAIVLISAEQPRWAEVLRRLRETQGVEWVGLSAARFDFIALVRATDLTELRDVVLQSLRAIPALTGTETAILLDEAGTMT